MPYRSRDSAVVQALNYFLEPSAHFWQFGEEGSAFRALEQDKLRVASSRVRDSNVLAPRLRRPEISNPSAPHDGAARPHDQTTWGLAQAAPQNFEPFGATPAVPRSLEPNDVGSSPGGAPELQTGRPHPSGTVKDFRTVDGKGIGVVVELSDGTTCWFFEDEIAPA